MDAGAVSMPARWPRNLTMVLPRQHRLSGSRQALLHTRIVALLSATPRHGVPHSYRAIALTLKAAFKTVDGASAIRWSELEAPRHDTPLSPRPRAHRPYLQSRAVVPFEQVVESARRAGVGL
jgi:hypothetical protein